MVSIKTPLSYLSEDILTYSLTENLPEIKNNFKRIVFPAKFGKINLSGEATGYATLGKKAKPCSFY